VFITAAANSTAMPSSNSFEEPGLPASLGSQPTHDENAAAVVHTHGIEPASQPLPSNTPAAGTSTPPSTMPPSAASSMSRDMGRSRIGFVDSSRPGSFAMSPRREWPGLLCFICWLGNSREHCLAPISNHLLH
jgi:hypothetical protein